MTAAEHRRRRGADDPGEALIEAPGAGEGCWPAFDPDGGSVLLLRSASGRDGARDAVWIADIGPERARFVFDWMAARPDRWALWARLACLFGQESLTLIVVEGAERDADLAAAEQEVARREAEHRRRQHERIDLFALDPKKGRPGLSLRSGDEDKPFFAMRFSEKWERERVLDWLRWQKPRYCGFRDIFELQGAVALERVIIAGMRETETEVRRRGLASGGRRPLRFWRGE